MKLLQKIEEKGMFLISFNETNITLIPKPYKEHTKKITDQ